MSIRNRLHALRGSAGTNWTRPRRVREICEKPRQETVNMDKSSFKAVCPRPPSTARLLENQKFVIINWVKGMIRNHYESDC